MQFCYVKKILSTFKVFKQYIRQSGRREKGIKSLEQRADLVMEAAP